MTPRIDNEARIDVLQTLLRAECSMHILAGADGKVIRDVAKASLWAADIRQARAAVAELIAAAESVFVGADRMSSGTVVNNETLERLASALARIGGAA